MAYKRFKTLYEYLRDPRWADFSFRLQHMQLARLVAGTHKNLSLIERIMTTSTVLPSNYIYYLPNIPANEGGTPDNNAPTDIEHTNDSEIDGLEENILSPFLFCGLGSKPKRSNSLALVQSSGVTAHTTSHTRIIELGLILFQIGSWQTLRYSAARRESGYDNMRQEAKNKMHQVYRHSGVGFAQVVLTCLDWQGHKKK